MKTIKYSSCSNVFIYNKRLHKILTWTTFISKFCRLANINASATRTSHKSEIICNYKIHNKNTLRKILDLANAIENSTLSYILKFKIKVNRSSNCRWHMFQTTYNFQTQKKCSKKNQLHPERFWTFPFWKLISRISLRKLLLQCHHETYKMLSIVPWHKYT